MWEWNTHFDPEYFCFALLPKIKLAGIHAEIISMYSF